MIGALLVEMSAGNESAVFFTPSKRRAILRGVFTNYYDKRQPGQTVFDTNRGWTIRNELLADLFPHARMICCVRHIPWIIDSVERLVRANPFELSKIFNFDSGGTVYSRAEGLMAATGLIGFPLNALKQAMLGPQSDRILLLPYDTLVNDPAAAMEAVYAFIGHEPFTHDFENVVFDASEFDARLGTPGLHHVRPQVRGIARETILPGDLWERYERTSVWRNPALNRRGVPVACEAAELPPGFTNGPLPAAHARPEV